MTPQQMTERERNDRGRFTKEHPDSAVIATVLEHEPAATREVADALGVRHASAYRRLVDLRASGRLDSKMIGGSLAWSVSED